MVATAPRTTSSIYFGSSAGCTIPPPVPEVPLDASSALGTGYGEAKWIAERILQNVTMRAGISTVIVRLGQVSGDKNSQWNEREWFPALVKSALSVRCLPDVEGVSMRPVCADLCSIET